MVFRVRSRTAAISLLGATLLTCAMPATAARYTTLVDTGEQVDGAAGGPVLSASQYVAGRFTLASDATLTDVYGYIASSRTVPVRLALRSDAGALPGTVLYAATFDTVAVPGAAVWQGLLGLDWKVGAGTYWLAFEGAGSPGAFMPGRASAPLDSYAVTTNGATTWRASRSLVGLRINGLVAEVPEPATWAMMVVGFGATGAALRRRRRRATAFG